MSVVVGSLIAVAGTLLGSLSTYWFQQKVAWRTEATARQERLRQDQLAACNEFAAAVLDWRSAVVLMIGNASVGERVAQEQGPQPPGGR